MGRPGVERMSKDEELLQFVLDVYGSIPAFQAACGLEMSTVLRDDDLRTAEIVRAGAPPVPHQSRAHEVYGRPTYKGLGGGKLRVDPLWQAEFLAPVALHNGVTVYLHRLCAEGFADLFRRACAVSGYTPVQVVGWLPRHLDNDSSYPPSLHAYGAAVDFDPRLPAGGSGPREHLAFVEEFERGGWSWGGYNRRKEDGHFQRAWY